MTSEWKSPSTISMPTSVDDASTICFSRMMKSSWMIPPASTLGSVVDEAFRESARIPKMSSTLAVDETLETFESIFDPLGRNFRRRIWRRLARMRFDPPQPVCQLVFASASLRAFEEAFEAARPFVRYVHSRAKLDAFYRLTKQFEVS